MNGETILIPERLFRNGKSFSDFDVGEGYLDRIREVRVKISDDLYFHLNDSVVEINEARDWPTDEKVKIRQFRLIVREI